MKTAILVLSILGFGMQTLAAEGESLRCENGPIAKMGDAHYAINVFEDGLEFQPYESGFSIDAGDIKYANKTFTIKNVKTELSVEGETSQIVVNGTVKLSNDDKKLVAKIRIGNGPTKTLNMSCVTINHK